MDPQEDSIHKALDIFYKYTSRFIDNKGIAFLLVRPKAENQLC